MVETRTADGTSIVGKRILVIEDDQFIRNVYVKWFSTRGAEVLTANDGALGLEVLGTQKIDLVLLDLGMPGLNGEDTLRSIRANESLRSLPVLILTNTALEKGSEEYTQLTELGVARIMQKHETSLEELAAVVADCFVQKFHEVV